MTVINGQQVDLFENLNTYTQRGYYLEGIIFMIEYCENVTFALDDMELPSVDDYRSVIKSMGFNFQAEHFNDLAESQDPEFYGDPDFYFDTNYMCEEVFRCLYAWYKSSVEDEFPRKLYETAVSVYDEGSGTQSGLELVVELLERLSLGENFLMADFTPGVAVRELGIAVIDEKYHKYLTVSVEDPDGEDIVSKLRTASRNISDKVDQIYKAVCDHIKDLNEAKAERADFDVQHEAPVNIRAGNVEIFKASEDEIDPRPLAQLAGVQIAAAHGENEEEQPLFGYHEYSETLARILNLYNDPEDSIAFFALVDLCDKFVNDLDITDPKFPTRFMQHLFSDIEGKHQGVRVRDVHIDRQRLLSQICTGLKYNFDDQDLNAPTRKIHDEAGEAALAKESERLDEYHYDENEEEYEYDDDYDDLQ